MGASTTSRFILALALLFVPLAGAGAQQIEPTAKTVERPVAGDYAAPEDVLPQPIERPVFQTQGVLVETLDGQTVMGQAVDQGYNPASAVKLLTALVALRNFGPTHRFATAIWVTGPFNRETGTVTGDLIVSGRDPSFHYEHAVSVARQLNQLGIRTVTGDLVIAPRFTMNYGPSSLRSGEVFYDTLDATRRPAAATRAWQVSRSAVGDAQGAQMVPSVAVMGAVYVGSVPREARVVLTHYSSQLKDVLKILLCYSNNFMAERVGDAVGGPLGLHRFLTSELRIPAHEARLATASGLGINRLSPRNMMKVYRALLDELAKGGLGPEDIMPVAGIDPGTLQKRYANSFGRGSVIGKTGTLGRTDGGVSALVGQFRTRSGETLLFVIFNQRGNVARFRYSQDQLIAQLQSARGGPAQFVYAPQPFVLRLASTEFDSANSAGLDEYEQPD